LQSQTTDFLKDHREQLIRITHIIEARPAAMLKEAKKDLLTQDELFKRTIKTRLKNDRMKLDGYKKMIDFVHPINTIKRGFSITRTSNGKTLRHKADVKMGEELVTEVVDGSISSIVE